MPDNITAPPTGWRFALGLTPALLFWGVLVGLLANSIYARTGWWRKADEANLAEWLTEGRTFRKSLPELVRDYLDEYDKTLAGGEAELEFKADEIREHLRALVDPTRLFQGQIHLYPEVYRLEVQFPASALDSIRWDSPVNPPRQQQQTKVHTFSHNLLGKDSQGREDRRAKLVCQYRMHAYAEIQRQNEEQATVQWVVGGLVFTASMAALFWVYYYLRRERLRESEQYRILQDKEHAERLLLENELLREELDKKLLAQRLDTARVEQRAAEAEKNTAELKSQLYASIGIMAGSYAHNIKNLLVRPNDLLARCLEADGLAPPQTEMLHEVRHTLGTVTERLQQILRTVRRDPSRSEVTVIDLNEVVHDTHRTWKEMARDKWKVVVTANMAPEPLTIRGDLSHLQQAIENLLFNARDSTFEMRNYLREQARTDPTLDPATRRQAVIDAAAWKGVVALKTWAEGDVVVLEVADNGIGMTEEVRSRCTQTHFTTKRDNALYEGYNAGMGLGLSFVAMVLEHHGAQLEIDSAPLRGARFRLRFPRADAQSPTTRPDLPT